MNIVWRIKSGTVLKNSRCRSYISAPGTEKIESFLKRISGTILQELVSFFKGIG
jgi:hypothetical protein